MTAHVGLQLEALSSACRWDITQGVPSSEAFTKLEEALATPAASRALPLRELYEAILLSNAEPWPRISLLRDALSLLTATARGILMPKLQHISINFLQFNSNIYQAVYTSLSWESVDLVWCAAAAKLKALGETRVIQNEDCERHMVDDGQETIQKDLLKSSVVLLCHALKAAQVKCFRLMVWSITCVLSFIHEVVCREGS
jgi:hypothetical protein